MALNPCQKMLSSRKNISDVEGVGEAIQRLITRSQDEGQISGRGGGRFGGDYAHNRNAVELE